MEHKDQPTSLAPATGVTTKLEGQSSPNLLGDFLTVRHGLASPTIEEKEPGRDDADLRQQDWSPSAGTSRNVFEGLGMEVSPRAAGGVPRRLFDSPVRPFPERLDFHKLLKTLGGKLVQIKFNNKQPRAWMMDVVEAVKATVRMLPDEDEKEAAVAYIKAVFRDAAFDSLMQTDDGKALLEELRREKAQTLEEVIVYVRRKYVGGPASVTRQREFQRIKFGGKGINSAMELWRAIQVAALEAGFGEEVERAAVLNGLPADISNQLVGHTDKDIHTLCLLADYMLTARGGGGGGSGKASAISSRSGRAEPERVLPDGVPPPQWRAGGCSICNSADHYWKRCPDLPAYILKCQDKKKTVYSSPRGKVREVKLRASEEGPLFFVRVEIGSGHSLQALVDLGANTSVARADILPAGTNISPSSVYTLDAYDGTTQRVLGAACLPLTFGGDHSDNTRTLSGPLLVVERLDYPLIIGNNILIALDAVISPRDGMLWLRALDLWLPLEAAWPGRAGASVATPSVNAQTKTPYDWRVTEKEVRAMVTPGLNEEERAQVIDLVLEFRDVVVGPGKFPPPAKGEPVHIRTRGNPVKPPFRHQSWAIQAKVRRDVQRWLDADLIELARTGSPYFNYIVYAKKADGTDRAAFDLRWTNLDVENDIYPANRMDEEPLKLVGHTHFNSFDSPQAFWMLMLDQESRRLTAFASDGELYWWKRMPFGLAPATSNFDRRMRRDVIAELPDEVRRGTAQYVDNVVNGGVGFPKALAAARETFKAYRAAGFSMKFADLQIGAPSASFGGFLFSASGWTAGKKVEKLKLARMPATNKELQSLLGLTQYFSPLIKGYAEMVGPLHKIGSAVRLFKDGFDEEAERRVQELINELNSPPVLGLLDATKPITIYTDASGEYGVGGWLEQDGRPVRFISRLMTTAERKYEKADKELLALSVVLDKCDYILDGRQITWRTDNVAAATWQTMKTGGKADGDQHRIGWFQQFSQYNINTEAINRKDNVVADAIVKPPFVGTLEAVEEELLTPKTTDEFEKTYMTGRAGDDVPVAMREQERRGSAAPSAISKTEMEDETKKADGDAGAGVARDLLDRMAARVNALMSTAPVRVDIDYWREEQARDPMAVAPPPPPPPTTL